MKKAYKLLRLKFNLLLIPLAIMLTIHLLLFLLISNNDSYYNGNYDGAISFAYFYTGNKWVTTYVTLFTVGITALICIYKTDALFTLGMGYNVKSNTSANIALGFLVAIIFGLVTVATSMIAHVIQFAKHKIVFNNINEIISVGEILSTFFSIVIIFTIFFFMFMMVKEILHKSIIFAMLALLISIIVPVLIAVLIGNYFVDQLEFFSSWKGWLLGATLLLAVFIGAYATVAIRQEVRR